MENGTCRIVIRSVSDFSSLYTPAARVPLAREVTLHDIPLPLQDEDPASLCNRTCSGPIGFCWETESLMSASVGERLHCLLAQHTRYPP